MKSIFKTSLYVSILVSTGASSLPIEWGKQPSGNGNFYELILTPALTLNQASSSSKDLDSEWQLATDTSVAEHADIEGLLSPDSPYFNSSCLVRSLLGLVCEGAWLGGYSSLSSSRDWQWGTGEVINFFDWAHMNGLEMGIVTDR